MYKDDVCIGTIKKCLNFHDYKKYGKEYYCVEEESRTMKMISTVENVTIVEENAVLVRTLHGYIRVNDISSFFVDFRLAYELYNCILLDLPYATGDLFVDETTIRPFYKENDSKKVKVKKLKKEVKVMQYNRK